MHTDEARGACSVAGLGDEDGGRGVGMLRNGIEGVDVLDMFSWLGRHALECR